MNITHFEINVFHLLLPLLFIYKIVHVGILHDKVIRLLLDTHFIKFRFCETLIISMLF